MITGVVKGSFNGWVSLSGILPHPLTYTTTSSNFMYSIASVFPMSRECVLLPGEPGDIVSCTCYQYAVSPLIGENDDQRTD